MTWFHIEAFGAWYGPYGDELMEDKRVWIRVLYPEPITIAEHDHTPIIARRARLDNERLAIQ